MLSILAQETLSLFCHRSNCGGPHNNREIQPWIPQTGMQYTSCCHTGEMHLAADSYSLPLKERPNIWGHAGELFLEQAISFPCIWYHRYIVLIESIHQLEHITAAPQHKKDCWISTSFSNNTPKTRTEVKKPFRHLPSALNETVFHTHLLLVAKTNSSFLLCDLNTL